MNVLSKIYIEPEQILYFLRKTIHLKETYEKISHQQIISQAAEVRGLMVTDAEIQAEGDRIRLEKRLEKAADTLTWLANEMITPEDWEAGICDRLLSQKLAEHLFAKEVKKFFAENQLNFQQISLYQIIVPYDRVAQELFYQIEEEEISFFEAAHFYDIDAKRRYQCGYEGKLYRWDLKPDLAAVVFSAKIGEVIGPLQTEQGYHLLRVEEFVPAELTPERYKELLDTMFKQWLEGELTYMIHNQ